MGTTDSPTPADDLAELRAYAEKGPAVSRATCGRIADRLEAAGPDLRTAARALLDEMTEVIEQRIGPSSGADPIPLEEGEAESLIIDWFRTLQAAEAKELMAAAQERDAARAALAAETTEPPPARICTPGLITDGPPPKAIDIDPATIAPPGSAPNPQGADEPSEAERRVREWTQTPFCRCGHAVGVHAPDSDSHCSDCGCREFVLAAIGNEAMAAVGAPDEPTDDDRVSVVANAIGYAMFCNDGRPVTITEPGEVGRLTVNDEELERCQAAARFVLTHLGTFDAMRSAVEQPSGGPVVLWEQETKPSDGDPAKSYIAPPLLGCPPGTSVAVVQTSPRVPPPEVPAFDPDAFDADALVVILGLADLDPLVGHDGAPPARCALCGAEAPGGAQTLAPSQHLGGCLWVSARELAEVVRGGPETP